MGFTSRPSVCASERSHHIRREQVQLCGGDHAAVLRTVEHAGACEHLGMGIRCSDPSGRAAARGFSDDGELKLAKFNTQELSSTGWAFATVCSFDEKLLAVYTRSVLRRAADFDA
eukprot:gnl/TRDRNA2_/TRDRNA2_173093_c1_seq1.p2 gnl/TRDRNA2_/TRDRNA2_173093_c1~~gnl/TRDRNA2_/TRDRNA2_173093_c1_seq1.p2  ORF type:complete len:115 (-),score=23.05 gnl/TRDRNA2_/TRDRNA2_173093_c1_seq1:194-538(-)